MFATRVVHTIGHSDHTIDAFISLLRRHRITLVVDVRSYPYSRWALQFNREILNHDLGNAGYAYRFMGDVLGGRPADPALYDAGQDRPDYERMERTVEYQAAIDQLLGLIGTEKVAIMCSEGDHHHCHRHLLIAQTLLSRGISVLHIQPDGATLKGEPIPSQPALF